MITMTHSIDDVAQVTVFEDEEVGLNGLIELFLNFYLETGGTSIISIDTDNDQYEAGYSETAQAQMILKNNKIIYEGMTEEVEDEEIDTFAEGAEAYRMEQDLTDNPYSSVLEHVSWINGYLAEYRSDLGQVDL